MSAIAETASAVRMGNRIIEASLMVRQAYAVEAERKAILRA
jgi:hypothetical protein